jgi:hypothetical protein
MHMPEPPDPEPGEPIRPGSFLTGLTPGYPFPLLTEDAYRDTETLLRHLRGAVTEWAELIDAADRRAREWAGRFFPADSSTAARFLVEECKACGTRWLAATLAQMSPLDKSCRGLAAWCHLQQEVLRTEERHESCFELCVHGESAFGPEMASEHGEQIDAQGLDEEPGTAPTDEELRRLQQVPNVLDPVELLALALPLILGDRPDDEWGGRVRSLRLLGTGERQGGRSRFAPVICTTLWPELREWGHKLHASTPREPVWSDSIDALGEECPPPDAHQDRRLPSPLAVEGLLLTESLMVRGPLPTFAEARRQLDKARNWLITVQLITHTAAEAPPERLRFDPDTYGISLDDQAFPGVDPTAFRLLRALYNGRHNGPLSGRELQRAAGMTGKNLNREWDKLPGPLRDLVLGAGGKGYSLRLPARDGALASSP